MLRLLIVGSILIGIGMGLQRGWIQLNWDRFYSDLGVPVDASGQPDPLRSLSDSPYKMQR